MCMPRSVMRRGSGRGFARCSSNGPTRLPGVVGDGPGLDAVHRATKRLGRLEHRATIRVDASLDLATSERGDPALRRPAVVGPIPCVEVREHLVERHDAQDAVALAPEDDVRPAADADGSMPAAVHAHPTRGDGVHEHALEARPRQERDGKEVAVLGTWYD